MAEVFVRGLLIVILLAFAAFCAFGCLATFEPPGWPVLRVVYGGIGTASVVGAGLLTRGMWRRAVRETQ